MVVDKIKIRGAIFEICRHGGSEPYSYSLRRNGDAIEDLSDYKGVSKDELKGFDSIKEAKEKAKQVFR